MTAQDKHWYGMLAYRLLASEIEGVALESAGTRLSIRREIAPGSQAMTIVRAEQSGLFQRRYEPSERDYVATGDRVNRGSTLGLVAAGGILFPILAPFDGIVAAIWMPRGAEVIVNSPILAMLREN